MRPGSSQSPAHDRTVVASTPDGRSRRGPTHAMRSPDTPTAASWIAPYPPASWRRGHRRSGGRTRGSCSPAARACRDSARGSHPRAHACRRARRIVQRPRRRAPDCVTGRRSRHRARRRRVASQAPDPARPARRSPRGIRPQWRRPAARLPARRHAPRESTAMRRRAGRCRRPARCGGARAGAATTRACGSPRRAR